MTYLKMFVLSAVAFVGLQAASQNQKKDRNQNRERNHEMMKLSAEDIATIQTKKMTLFLDLNDSQQIAIQKINLENATQKKAMMEAYQAKKASGELSKPSGEDKLNKLNKSLDHQIAMKAKMKSILNDDQFAKWEKVQQKKNMHRKKGKKSNKKRGKKNKE